METSNSTVNENSNNSIEKKEEETDIKRKLYKTVKISFIIATICIVCLTIIASVILLSNYHSQNTSNSLIKHIATSCKMDSLNSESNNAKFVHIDTIDTRYDINKINEKNSANIVSKPTETTDFLNSIVYNLTLAVNTINNILTSGAIFIAILTLFIGLVGLFGYHSLKTDTKDELYKTMTEVNGKGSELKKDINKRVDKTEESIKDIRKTIEECCNDSKKQILSLNKELLTLKDNIDKEIQDELSGFNEKITDFNKRVEQIKDSLIQQARYFDQTNNCLYQMAYSSIEQMDNKAHADQLLEKIFHELQIAKLYRTNLDPDEKSDIDIHKIAAFEYLEEYGTMEDIPHLDHVAKHDPDEQNKRRAVEVTAIIRNRSRKY